MVCIRTDKNILRKIKILHAYMHAYVQCVCMCVCACLWVTTYQILFACQYDERLADALLLHYLLETAAVMKTPQYQEIAGSFSV